MQKGCMVICIYVAQNVDWKKLWAETRGGQNEHFLPLYSNSECKAKIDM